MGCCDRRGVVIVLGRAVAIAMLDARCSVRC